MTRKQALYMSWHNVMSVCCWHGLKYEGCKIEKKWKTFEGFYKDNYNRYYLAEKKWKNYKKVTPISSYKYRAKKTNQVRRHINFVRKIKNLGYTKKNTCFTSASDRMKFFKGSNRIVFNEKQILGTRDIKNMLEKKGIKRTMNNLQSLLRAKKSLFAVNRLRQWKYKGKYRSLREIAEFEKISERCVMLKNKVVLDKFSVKKAVKYCKDYLKLKNKSI